MNGGGHAPACASGVPHPPPAAGDKRKWTSSAPSTASTAASAWGSSPVDIKPALAQGAVAPGAVAHVSSVKRKTVNVSRFCTSRLATGNGAAYALAKNLISVSVYRVAAAAAASADEAAASTGSAAPPRATVSTPRTAYDLFYVPPAACRRAAAEGPLAPESGWYLSCEAGDEIEVVVSTTGGTPAVNRALQAHLAGRSTVNARVYAEVRVDGKGLGVAKELGCVNGRSLSPRTVTFKGFSTFDSRDKLTSTRRIRLGRTTPVDDGSAAPAAATACVGRITVSLSVRYEHPTKKVELPRVVRPPRRRPRAGAGLLSSAAGSPLANGPPLADAEDTTREAVRLSEKEAVKDKSLFAVQGTLLDAAGSPMPVVVKKARQEPPLGGRGDGGGIAGGVGGTGGADAGDDDDEEDEEEAAESYPQPTLVPKVRWIRGFADLAVTLHYREPFWFFRNRFTNEAGRPLIVSTRHHEEAMAAAAARTAAKAAKAATTAAAATEAGAATPSASGEAGPLAPVADGDSDCEVVEEGAAGYVPPPAADQRKVLASVYISSDDDGDCDEDEDEKAAVTAVGGGWRGASATVTTGGASAASGEGSD